MTFIGLEPFNKVTEWKRLIGNAESSESKRCLRALLQVMLLRRSLEDIPAVAQLQPLTENIQIVTMGTAQRRAYDDIFKASKLCFRAACLAGRDAVLKNFANVLEWILRLRQGCCATELIGKSRLKVCRDILRVCATGRPEAINSDTMTQEEAAELYQTMLQMLRNQRATANCCICFESIHEDQASILRGCRHCFCHNCLETYLGTSSCQACPLCRHPYTMDDITDWSALHGHGDGNGDGDGDGRVVMKVTSAKIDALVQAIQTMQRTDKEERAIVYSGFVRFLDLIENVLKKHHISCVRLVGSMTQQQRRRAITSFQNGEIDVMLVSMMAGSTGLNLTRWRTKRYRL